MIKTFSLFIYLSLICSLCCSPKDIQLTITTDRKEANPHIGEAATREWFVFFCLENYLEED